MLAGLVMLLAYKRPLAAGMGIQKQDFNSIFCPETNTTIDADVNLMSFLFCRLPVTLTTDLVAVSTDGSQTKFISSWLISVKTLILDMLLVCVFSQKG